MQKRIIVGLGNVGKEYEKTRHNVGFLAVDMMAVRYEFPPFVHEKSLHAYVSGKLLDDAVTLLVKPDTFMNKSGDAVQAIMHYYKVDPQHVLVIYDDVDIPLGESRFRQKGSSGTHNGMRHIVQVLGTEDIPRIRIGIKPDHPIKDLSAFVLGRFTEDERAAVLREIDSLSLSPVVDL